MQEVQGDPLARHQATRSDCLGEVASSIGETLMDEETYESMDGYEWGPEPPELWMPNSEEALEEQGKEF